MMWIIYTRDWISTKLKISTKWNAHPPFFIASQYFVAVSLKGSRWPSNQKSTTKRKYQNDKSEACSSIMALIWPWDNQTADGKNRKQWNEKQHRYKIDWYFNIIILHLCENLNGKVNGKKRTHVFFHLFSLFF